MNSIIRLDIYAYAFPHLSCSCPLLFLTNNNHKIELSKYIALLNAATTATSYYTSVTIASISLKTHNKKSTFTLNEFPTMWTRKLWQIRARISIQPPMPLLYDMLYVVPSAAAASLRNTEEGSA